MVMDYLDNRGVVEETDETEFMRALRKRLYYAIFFRSSIYDHVNFNDSNASLVLYNSPSNSSFQRLSIVFCFIPIAEFATNELNPSLTRFFNHSLAS